MTTAATHKRTPNGYGPPAPPNAAVDAHAAVLSMAPPQAPAMEEAVVGAVLIDRTALPIVVEILKPESFYSPALSLTYKACLSLWAAQEPVDILSVAELLRKTGELEKVGGASYLADITNRIGSAANIEYHARIVAQKALVRRVIEGCNEYIRRAYLAETDAFGLMTEVQEWAFRLSNISGRQVMSAGCIVPGVMAGIAEAMQKPDGVTGIPTGLAIDAVTAGWQPSDLIIIGGRPGMGKTALALFCAAQAAKSGHGVLFFSLEMSRQQIVQRLISTDSGVSTKNMRSGQLSDDDLRRADEAGVAIGGLPIYIDDTPAITIGEMRTKARRQAANGGLGIVVVDYLQLMGGGTENNRNVNREQEVAAFSRGLKQLAKELNVPVIALSQLSRSVESRASKRPMLSDLRDSGAVEQDADLVAFCYRPEYYDIFTDEKGRDVRGLFEFIVAKNRHGSTDDDAGLRFDAARGRFSNLDEPTTSSQFPAMRPVPPSVSRPANDEDIPF